MLIAVNVVIFILGFVIALVHARRSKKTQSEVDSVLSRVQHVTEKLKAGSLKGALEEATVQDLERQYGSEVKPGSHLLTKEDVETRFEESSWQRLAYDEFKSTILGKSAERKTFPCVYATMGYRSNDHRYIFLESDDPSEPRNLRLVAPGIKEYLDMSKTLGPNTSLVIIGAPSSRRKTVQDYNASFWDMLRGLRIKDSVSWPADIPQDTEHEKWTFCFDGQPLFPVMLTPAHQRRWSRHMSVPVIAMQPKWVLDNLLGTPEKRESAVGKVRKLLAEYDQVGISPDLTSYGQPGTSEARQLCLMDENETAECKYSNFDR